MARERPTRSARQRPTRALPGIGDEHESLVSEIGAMLERERLHVPAQITEDRVDLPFNLTTISDEELRRLHGAFTAYSYREGYLLMLEEALEHKCKEAADEIVEAYIAQHGDGDGTMTVLKAQAEQVSSVKEWRKAQRMHGILGNSLRRERDNHDKVIERLSRQATMRNDEWNRANGGSTSSPRPTRRR